VNANLIQYPAFFEQKLQADQQMRSAIDAALTSVVDILKISRLPFFPDYTDHGPQHLSNVLDISDKLLSKGSRELLTAEDVAILVFSVLLHDLALHLSEAGFLSLIQTHDTIAYSSETLSWPHAWRQFIGIAKRWDDRKLVKLFGANANGEPLSRIMDPFDHYENLQESDRKLIGEFIRQHHARMAYEFAVSGFPGANDRRVTFNSFHAEFRDLAGAVARSHGLSLRTSLEYLEQQYNKIEYDNVHPLFLMAVLRIADYLDLGKDRAPLIAFQYKNIKSWFSQKEWKANQALRKISWGNPDSESIHIPTKPEDIFTFLELKTWLSAIQSELDTTWAVLGEVFGSHQAYSKFGLTIRRVRSNIDDVAAFSKTSSYVPKRIEFAVARAQLLKLLIRPLYGYKPAIGIREMMQNAIDAVRERRDFVEHHPEYASRPSNEQEADVVVWLDDFNEAGIATLTISDVGIGMTEETISDYFLKVGSSFRNSETWREEFEAARSSNDSTVAVKSRVLRSGRFGIGVLAAFLVAEEMEVFTRHVTAKRGIYFRVHFGPSSPGSDPDIIPLRYDANLPVGTTIRLKVSKVALKELPSPLPEVARTEFGTGSLFYKPQSWDWYCLQEPSVIRKLAAQGEVLQQATTVPGENGPLFGGWRSITVPGFTAVHINNDEAEPILICNGMKVSPVRSSVALTNFSTDVAFKMRDPSISVFDPDARLDLNLQRDKLLSLDGEFVDRVFDGIAKGTLAKAISAIPSDLVISESLIQRLRKIFRFNDFLPIIKTKTGVSLLTKLNLLRIPSRAALMINVRFEQAAKAYFGNYDCVIYTFSKSPLITLQLLRDMGIAIHGIRLLIKDKKKEIVSIDYDLDKYNIRLEEADAANGVAAVETNNCPKSLLALRGLGANIYGRMRGWTRKEHSAEARYFDYDVMEGRFGDFGTQLIGAEVFWNTQSEPLGKDKFSLGHYWDEVIGQASIPLNGKDRAVVIANVYRKLGEFSRDLAT